VARTRGASSRFEAYALGPRTRIGMPPQRAWPLNGRWTRSRAGAADLLPAHSRLQCFLRPVADARPSSYLAAFESNSAIFCATGSPRGLGGTFRLRSGWLRVSRLGDEPRAAAEGHVIQQPAESRFHRRMGRRCGCPRSSGLPYRNRSKGDHSGEWKQPKQQDLEVELLQTVEHRRRPAVFGTAGPPSGVSELMRRLAFRWSGSNRAH
jgi:hypothetical protein